REVGRLAGGLGVADRRGGADLDRLHDRGDLQRDVEVGVLADGDDRVTDDRRESGELGRNLVRPWRDVQKPELPFGGGREGEGGVDRLRRHRGARHDAALFVLDRAGDAAALDLGKRRKRTGENQRQRQAQTSHYAVLLNEEG